MRSSLVLLAGLSLFSCSPPCQDTSWTPSTVCLHADAGQALPNQPFTLTAMSYASGTCRVEIDGGAITLHLDGQYCDRTPAGAFAPRDPRSAANPCEIPALPAGTFTVNSDAPTTFTLPLSTTDAGVPNCP